MNVKKTFICLTAAGALAMQGVVPLAAHAETPQKSEVIQQGKPYPGHLIKRGDSGKDVRTVQNQLNKKGFPIYVDGIFGKMTEKKVKMFQARSALAIDGIVGKKTWTVLNIDIFPYPGHLIKQGDKGEDVKRIQARLNEAEINVSIDGMFGSKTKMAVEEFQKKFGLQADGIVGPETWDILFNYADNI
ncbi:peptidoglycan-binding domain-containing protein [Fictibacillus fluitans]|uniref:Peptidoglycan-binding protein n=1 Tax=Fictibacillus fluitans TaxID=3058422 RepID=A0ABT8HZ49_9BACL|nr:peptidoglycan-binding protein [Fictibacillus sp. NE201]MDN4526049.1 peptidoglycan-binding protein [Fictibacillus sp. NE201]